MSTPSYIIANSGTVATMYNYIIIIVIVIVLSAISHKHKQHCPTAYAMQESKSEVGSRLREMTVVIDIEVTEVTILRSSFFILAGYEQLKRERDREYRNCLAHICCAEIEGGIKKHHSTPRSIRFSVTMFWVR
jgi:hypothetical protein